MIFFLEWCLQLIVADVPIKLMTENRPEGQGNINSISGAVLYVIGSNQWEIKSQILWTQKLLTLQVLGILKDLSDCDLRMRPTLNSVVSFCCSEK